jgi:Glycoside hydrolase family 44
VKSRAALAKVAFSLDNEPDLWASTHSEVYPRPVTYAELWERNHRYAQAIKRVWPSAEVLGLVSYGWNGYVNLQNASDARGRDLLDWYLDQAKNAAGDGKRLIDYLDLHWYPEAQANGTRVSETSIAPDVVTARVQAPRSLWDPSYEESSWVRDFVGGPIDLLHRLSSKIAAHYPGTKISFSEWNYGAGHHISGGIATADVLGIFGREGVGMATLWPLSSNESFTYAALRAFRNYDGKGGAFGDVSVRAATSDASSVTAYASLKAGAADQVVVIAINKASTPKTVGLFVGHPTSFPAARVWELSGTAPELVPKGDLVSLGANTWRMVLPGYSVSVIVPHTP